VRELAELDRYVVLWERAAAFLGSTAKARSVARSIVLGLKLANFSHTDYLALSGEPADVYGVARVDGGWYVKLTVRSDAEQEDEMLFVISLHPAQEPIKTRGGMVNP
jgi:hypothetical protein